VGRYPRNNVSQIPQDVKSTSPINRSLILRPDQVPTCCAAFALNNKEGEAQANLRLVWFAQDAAVVLQHHQDGSLHVGERCVRQAESNIWFGC
jgi:uncharacterized protein involved in outer membrane biogenesis